MSMSKAEQMNIRTEQLQSLSRRPGLNNRFDIELQNSGDSALFNGMDEFDEDEKKFYDFEYVLTQNTGDKENAGFKITGTKGPKTEGISFIKS